MMNKAVQPVFFTPEGLNICKVASPPFVVKFCNITTRTKGFLAFSINDDLADLFVILQAIKATSNLSHISWVRAFKASGRRKVMRPVDCSMRQSIWLIYRAPPATTG
jgi:hypothetical protein